VVLAIEDDGLFEFVFVFVGGGIEILVSLIEVALFNGL